VKLILPSDPFFTLCRHVLRAGKPVALPGRSRRVHEFATCNPPDDFIINRTQVHNYRWGGERELWGAVRPERRGVPSTSPPLSLSLSLSLPSLFRFHEAQSGGSRAPRLKRTSAGKGHVGARSGRVKRATSVCAFSGSRVIG